MIKKGISTFLVLLCLFNSIGCYATKPLAQVEIHKLAEGDKILVTTQDNKVHKFTFQKIDEGTMYGVKKMIKYYKRIETQVVIQLDEIKSVQLEREETKSSFVALLIVGGLIVLLSTISISLK